MILHDADADEAFIARIDCRFPYDEVSASELIREGWRVSLNAAFGVLHELCRPPDTRAVEKDRLRELAALWADGPDHPLKAPVLVASHALIDGIRLHWREGVELMKRIGDFDGQRAALAIAYFASDCDTADGDQELEQTDAAIRKRWEANHV